MRKSVISLVLSASLVCGLLPVDGSSRKASAAVGDTSAVETLMADTTLEFQSNKKAAGDVAAEADAAPASGTEEKYATSGTCGDNAEWFINSDATLVVHGSGVLQKEEGGWPWAPFAKDIQRVVVEDGITALGAAGYSQISAFSSCESLTEAVFASTVSDLKFCLSGSMSELKDIWIYCADMANTFSGSGSSYPAPGSGTKWHIHEGTTTEKSLREGLKLTDEDIEYITEDQEFPAVGNSTPVTLPEETDTSGISGLLSKWEWDDSTQTLTFSGEGVISISEGYYEKHKETAEHIIIESGITQIDASMGIGVGGALDIVGAFSKFTVLEDVDLPDTLKKIGDGTFNSSSLTRLADGLPEGLEEIGKSAFRNSTLSGDLILPGTLKEIGEAGFQGADIASVGLHEGMDLGGGCFRDCDSLREVTLPGGIIYGMSVLAGGNAPREASTFADCDSLEKVVIEGAGKAKTRGDDIENALPQRMFFGCPSLKEVQIETEELAYVEALGRDAAGEQNGGTFDVSNDPTFKLYKGSTTEATLTEAGYLAAENTEYLPVDTTALAEAVARAEGIDTAKYTEESAGALDAALTDAREILGQEYPLPSAVKAAMAALEEAIAALEEKGASPGGDSGDSTPAPDGSGDGGTTQPSTAPDGNNTPDPSGSGNNTPAPGGGNGSGSTAKEKAAKDKAAAEKAMAQAKIAKLTAKSKAKKKLKVSWKKAGKATGYEVQVSQKKNFKKKLFDKFTAKRTMTFNKKLKSKKIYYVRARAYATYKDAGGVTRKVYSKWSKKCKVKVK